MSTRRKPGKAEAFDYRCEFCGKGTVRRIVRPREFFPTSREGQFVALENVPIGVCDRCQERYYPACVLRQVEALRLKKSGSRNVAVPVARYVPVP